MSSSSRRGYAAPASSSTRRAPGANTPKGRSAPGSSPASRHGKAAAVASSTGARRSPRPAWNSYLTDETQYKLSRERQLVRQMQQLSAAHFHTRASPSRRQDLADSSYQYDDHDRLHSRDNSESSHSSHASSSQQSSQPRRTESASVGDCRESARSPDRLRGELSAREHMLSDLELEAERVNGYESQLAGENGYMDESRRSGGEYGRAGEEQPSTDALSVVYEDDDDIAEEANESGENDGDASDDGAFFDDPVAQICYKSLRVGIDLTQKMQLLAQKLDAERRHRKDQDKRIRELEQLCLATQRRNDAVEARYDDLASQVEAMRDAMIATEEALHRVTQELVRSKERDTSFSTDHQLDHHHSEPSEYLSDHDVEAEIREDGSLRSRPSWRPAHNGLLVNSERIQH